MSHKTPILVVIDMQPSFPASAECRAAVRDKVRRWERAVVVLEYVEEEPTFPDIMTSVRHRDKFAVMSKIRNSGASEVLAVARHWYASWPKDNQALTEKVRFVLCGVNLSWCVHETATELADAGFDVEVDVSACADSDSGWLNPAEENAKQDNIRYTGIPAEVAESVDES